MRQKLSKGMIVAGAATSILSVCAIPAFADSDTREATADTLGALAYDAPGLVEPGALIEIETTAVVPEDG